METISKTMPMDTVYEILAFSGHANMRGSRLIFRIPKEDLRYEIVKAAAEQKILFFMMMDMVISLV
jgi:hypothetical protein